MAPRVAARREPATVDYSAVGKQGRRTGVVLDQQPLDAYGIEQISGIFSSPRKPSPLKNMMLMESVEEDEHSVISQAQSARRTARSTPVRLPQSISPRKSGISGTARKSNGVDIFSVRRQDSQEPAEDRENSPEPASSSTPSTPSLRRTSNQTVHTVRTKGLSTTPQKSSPSTSKSARSTSLQRRRASLELSRLEAEPTPSVDDEEFDANDEAVQEVEAAVHTNADTAISSEREHEQTTIAQGNDTLGPNNDDVPLFMDEYSEEEQVPEPEPGPEVVQTTPAALPNKANSTRKRKSDVMEEDETIELPKKKGRPPKNLQKKTAAASPRPKEPNLNDKRPLREKHTNTKLSSRQEKELEEIVEKVKARPGAPRSLYILRRETPVDDAAAQTRSGRISIKPLAYWRNERCVYGTSPNGASLADGARFPLNSIKEIVRSEQIEESPAKKTARKKKKKKNGGKKGTNGSKDRTSAEEDDTSDSDLETDSAIQDPNAEAWETESGTLRGNVALWDNVEQAPTEQEEEIEIAHAPAAIKTREVKGAGTHDGPTFRYAKLLSTRFFGTGLVDLEPGGVKRPKNSRKMHMSFFVVKGRVTVTVGPLGGEDTGSINRFSIGKGGFWQVPRGNQYSIENELDKSARIFFSQGCEPEPAEDVE